MAHDFSDLVTTEEQLRTVMGHPAGAVVAKAIRTLDEHCRAFIARSPFVLVGSSDAQGKADVSPRGDPQGFVEVLDDVTLAIPERPGNRRADTYQNVLQNPHVGLLFLIPGKAETLRVNGRAKIVRDEWLRQRLAIQDKLPDFALVVTVEEAFLHCAKCVMRSKLWQPDHWPDQTGLASLARALVDHAKLKESVGDVQDMIDKSYRDRLY